MEMINGYQCKNCTDVDYAKKHIDPAHPKDGPYGVNAQDAGRAGKTEPGRKADRSDVVVFDGALKGLNAAPDQTGSIQKTPTSVGAQLDIVA
jgi:hypothetical protein